VATPPRDRSPSSQALPYSNAKIRVQGDLFGTTGFGGTSAGPNNAGYGTVFEITDSGFSTHKTPSCSVLESHDNFVFDPKLGENTSVHSNVQDETINHFKSEFADLAASLAQAHHDEAHPLAHDDHPASLTAQYAHHFLV
jgi:hypothetical protein